MTQRVRVRFTLAAVWPLCMVMVTGLAVGGCGSTTYGGKPRQPKVEPQPAQPSETPKDPEPPKP